MNRLFDAYRGVLLDALSAVYREAGALAAGEPPARGAGRHGAWGRVRANERAVVFRLGVHADPHVAGVFGRDAVVDAEYSRIGVGIDPKRITRRGAVVARQIFPDLIFHHRSDPAGNFLVVEVKLGQRRRAGTTRPDPDDLAKILAMTDPAAMTAAHAGSAAYTLGLCLDLRPDVCFLHWVHGGEECGRQVVRGPGDRSRRVDVLHSAVGHQHCWR